MTPLDDGAPEASNLGRARLVLEIYAELRVELRCQYRVVDDLG